MSSEAIGSEQPTPTEARARPVPEGPYRVQDENPQGHGLHDTALQTLPGISAGVKGTKAFDVSILAVLVAVQVAWVALLAYASLMLIR